MREGEIEGVCERGDRGSVRQWGREREGGGEKERERVREADVWTELKVGNLNCWKHGHILEKQIWKHGQI